MRLIERKVLSKFIGGKKICMSAGFNRTACIADYGLAGYCEGTYDWFGNVKSLYCEKY